MKCRLWQAFLVLLVVYSAWSSPFELAFSKASTGALLPVDLVVDAFFAIDIILTFFVAYLDKSTYLLVEEHKKIALRYVRISDLSITVIFFCFTIMIKFSLEPNIDRYNN